MTEQETYERPRSVPAEEAPPALPSEEYYRRHAPRQPNSATRLGALLVLIGLVWLAIELIGYGPFFGGAHSSARIPAPLPNNRLELYLGSGDVEIVPGESQEVTIETTQYGLWQGDPTAISQSSEGVRVTNEARPRFWLCLGRCGLSYHVTTPHGTNMTVQMSSGDVEVSRADGLVSIATNSGEVQAHDIATGITVSSSSGDVTLSRIGGKLDVRTSSGDVHLDEGQVVDAAVQTSSGDVELDGVAGALALQSSSGDITVRAARDGQLAIQTDSGDIDYTGSLAHGGDSSIAASSGDVTLHLPAASGFALEASTSSGDLRNDFELRGEQKNGRTLTGVVGAGGPRLKIATSSGDIAIEQ
jgi:Putative adhesin